MRGLLKFLAPVRKRAKPASVAALEPLVVHCAGRAVSVSLVARSTARRMILRLDRRTGTPVMTLPRGVSRQRAALFLNEHLGWLEARLKAAPQRIPFTDGTVIPFCGEPCRIVHRAPFRGETQLVEESGERLLVVHGDAAQTGTRVERFLKAEALRRFSEASARHAAALGVTHGKITIRDTRSRWGSCSARGELSFSWRLILAPPLVLDYLAAHEIAHRKEMNHSLRYWRNVAAIFPRFREAEHWLKREGGSLHRFG